MLGSVGEDLKLTIVDPTATLTESDNLSFTETLTAVMHSKNEFEWGLQLGS